MHTFRLTGHRKKHMKCTRTCVHMIVLMIHATIGPDDTLTTQKAEHL